MNRLFALLMVFSLLTAEEEIPVSTQESKAIRPFTGKVVGNKVRLRAKPNLNSPIIKELKANDLLIINGEADDFYAVLPAKGTKAYVYRKYVLDHKIDGDRVNVRLSPDTDAPVVAQLHDGDLVEGKLAGQDNKWLEIDIPASAHFYVAKDYIENIGGPDVLAKQEEKQTHVEELLSSAKKSISTEMNKPFPEIKITSIVKKLEEVSAEKDFPVYSSEAKMLLGTLQDNYLKKKMTYLEEQAKKIASSPSTEASPSSAETQMATWNDQEEQLYLQWQQFHTPEDTQEDFYNAEKENAVTLRGEIQPYKHDVKNRPGDFVLVSSSGVTSAYLYSTKVDLNKYVGQQVNVVALRRPNKNFAFPAYFALEVQ